MASITETQTLPVETMHMQLKSTPSSMAPRPPDGTKPKAKLRLDPLRALEPARKKLSTIESQRIMAVLVETIRRTELVSIMPYILENLDRFSVLLGSELLKLLQEHKVIIESFEELKSEATRLLEREQSNVSEKSYQSGFDRNSSSSKSRGPSASSSHKESQVDSAMRNLTLVAKQMQYSCKNILRAFSSDPSAMNAVLKDHKERNENAEMLIENMNELKEILLGMLLTTPVEELERGQYLKEVTERERYNAKVIDNLEVDLAAATQDKDADIKKKNDVIRRLQSDLHQIEKFSEEHMRRTKTEAEKQQAADTKNSDGKLSKLQQEYNQLHTQLQNLRQQHREKEGEQRMKKYRQETEVENWIQKYDTDMGIRQDKFEEIDAVYTEEKKQLNELEERFKTLETEYNQIMEERRISRERREAAERELQASMKAATTIQAFWRSFKVRKALKSKKKKGGKKK